MKTLVGACDQEKTLVGAFSVIVKLQFSRRFVSSSTGLLYVSTGDWRAPGGCVVREHAPVGEAAHVEAVQVQAPGRRHGLHHGAGVGEVVVAGGPVTRGQGVAVRTRVVAADLAPPNQL